MNTLSRKTLKIQLGAWAGALLMVGFGFTLPQLSNIEPAAACRDCPFPTPIAKLHWLMPGGLSEIMVQEVNLGGGRVMSIVRLVSRSTGELIAIGNLEHNKGRKRIKVDLQDAFGGSMEADLHYTNESRSQIRVKITCHKCNVQEAYLN